MSDTHTQEAKKLKVLPKPNSDFYQTFQMLSEAEQEKVSKVREFMQNSVAPIINDFWAKDEFPFDLVPGIRDLQISGLGYEGYQCAGGSNLLACYVAMEVAKVDCSIATFYGVHSGLAMGSIYLCGSEEQKKKWLPPMARLEKIGSFGLTEPLVGSGASGGLGTTARREGISDIIPKASATHSNAKAVRTDTRIPRSLTESKNTSSAAVVPTMFAGQLATRFP